MEVKQLYWWDHAKKGSVQTMFRWVKKESIQTNLGQRESSAQCEVCALYY